MLSTTRKQVFLHLPQFPSSSPSHWCVEQSDSQSKRAQGSDHAVAYGHSRPREDIGLRPLNQPKWFLVHSGHWYHPANQVPARLRQFHTWAQTRAYGHTAALNPWSSLLAFRSKPHYHSVSTHRERQWAHPGPPNLPGLTVKVPDPSLSPNGPASPRDFKFVNKNHCCGYLVLSALSPVCRLGRSGFQLEVWGLGVGEMGKKMENS